MQMLFARSHRWTTLAVATLLLAFPARGQGTAAAAAPAAPADEPRQRAKAELDAGVVAYQARRFQEAIEHFRAADRLVPNAALSFNVARACERLNDEAGALRSYRDFLRRAPGLADPNAELARARVTALEATLAARGQQQLSVFSEPPGAALAIDGRALGSTPWTGELAPGAHRLSLSLSGRQSVERAIDVSAAHALDLSVALPAAALVLPQPSAPAASQRGPAVPAEEAAPRTGFGAWPWVTLAAGGATLVAAGVFELSRRSAESDAQAPELPQIDFEERVRAMHSRQSTARVLAVVGGALVLGGGALVWFDPARRASQRTTASLACDFSSCRGSFAVRY
jgi:tetratricopeptide (TPR) repeat protein